MRERARGRERELERTKHSRTHTLTHSHSHSPSHSLINPLTLSSTLSLAQTCSPALTHTLSRSCLLLSSSHSVSLYSLTNVACVCLLLRRCVCGRECVCACVQRVCVLVVFVCSRVRPTSGEEVCRSGECESMGEGVWVVEGGELRLWVR